MSNRLITRYAAAQKIGKSPRTLRNHQAEWSLKPVRIHGAVSYSAESVDALLARLQSKADLEAANRTAPAPAGWRLLCTSGRGPFIGEIVPEAGSLHKRVPLDVVQEIIPGIARERRCIVSYTSLAEAFQVADKEGLNVISNGRGIVAVKEN